MNTNKTEKLMIEKLKTLPASDIAKLSFNAAGIDEKQHELLLDALPYGTYRLPTHEFRRHFEMLEWVCLVSGLLYWQQLGAFSANKLELKELLAVLKAIRDVISHYEIDFKKAEIMMLNANLTVFDDAFEDETYCKETYQEYFDGLVANAERIGAR